MTDQQLEQLSSILRALTNPIRLRVLLLLQVGELPVTQICQHLDVERTHLSHRLAKLTALGLIRTRRVGKQRLYSAVDSVLINPALIERLSQQALTKTTTNSMQPSQSRSIVP